MQGATVLSLMCVTLNKASLLFRGSKIGQINQNWASCAVSSITTFVKILLSIFSKNPIFSVFFNYGDDLHHFDPGEHLSGGLLLAPALCGPPTISCSNIWKVCCILIVGILS